MALLRKILTFKIHGELWTYCMQHVDWTLPRKGSKVALSLCEAPSPYRQSPSPNVHWFWYVIYDVSKVYAFPMSPFFNLYYTASSWQNDGATLLRFSRVLITQCNAPSLFICQASLSGISGIVLCMPGKFKWNSSAALWKPVYSGETHFELIFLFLFLVSFWIIHYGILFLTLHSLHGSAMD